MNTKILLKILKLGLGLIFTAVMFIFDAFASFNEDDAGYTTDGYSKEEDLGGISQANLFSSDNSHTGSGLNN